MMTYPGAPSFADAVEPLSQEFDGMLKRVLQPGERTIIARMTNTGEALVVTSARFIIFKDAAHSQTGKAAGRYFPLPDLHGVTRTWALFCPALIFLTNDTQRERRPWQLSHCSFAVTFREHGLCTNVAAFMSSMLAWLEQQRLAFIAQGAIPAITPPLGVISRPGERFYYSAGAALFEEQTSRVFQGGTQGVSFRLMRGVYYRVGGIRGRSVNQQEIKKTDTGILALSDRRLLFVGSMRTVDLPLSKIVRVTPFTDGLRVNLASGKIQQFETGEPNAARMLQRLCANPPP